MIMYTTPWGGVETANQFLKYVALLLLTKYFKIWSPDFPRLIDLRDLMVYQKVYFHFQHMLINFYN